MVLVQKTRRLIYFFLTLLSFNLVKATDEIELLKLESETSEGLNPIYIKIAEIVPSILNLSLEIKILLGIFVSLIIFAIVIFGLSRR